MGRPRRFRRIRRMPMVNYYKPAGVALTGLENVVITLGELEAVRLTSLENLSQIKAADKIGVSQPTIHRMLINFNQKIADALINGKAIKIEGGDYIMPGRDGTGPAGPRGQPPGRGRGRFYNEPAMCRCPNCKTKVSHTRGVPCIHIKCPKCGTLMMPE